MGQFYDKKIWIHTQIISSAILISIHVILLVMTMHNIFRYLCRLRNRTTLLYLFYFSVIAISLNKIVYFSLTIYQAGLGYTTEIWTSVLICNLFYSILFCSVALTLYHLAVSIKHLASELN